MSRRKLRVAVFGTGYWSQFQIPAWQSVGAEVTALWNRTHGKALRSAARFGIERVFDTPEAVFEGVPFDIADIITDVEAHEPLVNLAARYKKDVICQKPMAYSLEACRRMTDNCRRAGVWFAVHENFRYQPQFAPVKAALDGGAFGRVLHAHIQLKSPDRAIISKQPSLAGMDHMALRDMGPHIFDVTRYLFGDAESVYSRPVVSYADIGAEDTALSLLVMKSGVPVMCSLAHRFHYKVFVQCEKGVITLDDDNVITFESDGQSRTLDARTRTVLPYIPDDDWEIHGAHVFAAIPRCLEALAIESVDTLTPAYYDITLKSKASRDEESGEMLDIIFANRIFDMSFAFNTVGTYSFLQTQVKSSTNNFASAEASNREAFISKLDDIMESIDKSD